MAMGKQQQQQQDSFKYTSTKRKVDTWASPDETIGLQASFNQELIEGLLCLIVELILRQA